MVRLEELGWGVTWSVFVATLAVCALVIVWLIKSHDSNNNFKNRRHGN